MIAYLRLGLFPALAGVGLSACSSLQPITVLPSAGPVAAAAEMASPTGALIVYSLQQEFCDGGALSYPYSGYEIRSPTGVPLQTVPNHLGLSDQEPQRVALPEGRYLVLADCAGLGRVTVPVIIARRRTTVIHLDREPKSGCRCAPLAATGPQPFG